MTSAKRLVVHTGGAARGNPGPAAIGIVIADADGHHLASVGRVLGETTNNQAEYLALASALEMVAHYRPEHVDLCLDSELVVRQLQGSYRVRQPALKPLFERCRVLIALLPSVTLHHVPRSANKQADALANKALDQASLRPIDRS